MRHLLMLGFSTLALSSPALALTWSQIDNTYKSVCGIDLQMEDNEGIVQYTYCSDEHQDEIIAIGEVIGSSKAETLSSPVSVISTYELENRNQPYLADVLRSVPGVSVNRSGPGGGLTQIRMRGTEASHVLVLVDGVEVANPTAGEFDLSGLRASDVLKVEVLRGEQSALYGSDAIGGVINITTKGRVAINGWEASMEAGSFSTFDGQFNGTVPLGKFATASFGVGGRSTSGYDVSGPGGEKDGSENLNLTLGLKDMSLAGINFTAQYSDNRLKTDFDEDLLFSGRLDDTESTTIVDTKTARIDASFNIAGSFSNQITLSGHDITTDSQASFPSISKGTRRQARWAIEEDLWDDHNVTVLGEVETETYDISPSFAFQPTRPKNTNYAIAADYRYYGVNENFSVTASARQDFNDRFDDAFTWKLGGTYRHDWGGWHDGSLRVNVGTGVKNPSLIELFGFFPESNFVGNPDLRPEESFGYGIGYTHEYDDLEISIDYFKSELTDEIFTDFSSFPFLARNRDTDSQREGVELSAKWRLSETASLYGSATFLDTEENGVQELRRPEFQASATATVTPVKALSLTGSIDHTGSQLDTDFSTFQTVTLDSFTLVGLNAAYNVNDHVTLTLRGENLLDEDYEEVVGYRSQGRGVYGGLRLRFD